MHKLQRDLLLTFAIGSSVLIAIGGVVFLLTRPTAPEIAQQPVEPEPQVQHAVAVEPVVEVQPQTEVPAEPVMSQEEHAAKLVEVMRKPMTEFGLQDSLEAAARIVVSDSRESWIAANGVEQAAVGVWYAHKLYPDKPIQTKLGIGVLYAQLLNSAYGQPGESQSLKPTELIVMYNAFEKDLDREAAKVLGQVKMKALDNQARADGRVIKVEVLAKSVEYSRGRLRMRIINESSDKISFLHLQAEMTLLGKHVGFVTAVEPGLLPQEGRIIELSSRDELPEGFDDYVITIAKQPSEGHYVLEIER